MSNYILRQDMADMFINNVRIETCLDTVNVMDSIFGNGYVTQNHSYIRGFLNIEISQTYYDTEEDLMGSWMFWAKNPHGNKFDIGEYKGIYPIRFEIEHNYERDTNILKIEFSIDHINHYSDREKRYDLMNERNQRIEHFDKELFEL